MTDIEAETHKKHQICGVGTVSPIKAIKTYYTYVNLTVTRDVSKVSDFDHYINHSQSDTYVQVKKIGEQS